MAKQPWHELPPQIVAVLRPHVDEIAGEIIAAVRTVPAYSRPLEGPLGAGIREGVQEALGHLLAEIEASGSVARRDVYRSLGRGEMRAGRSLESLLSAYRAGARVAWRSLATIGSEAGFAPETLYQLAESIFAYIDVLSAESAEGYASEQSAAAGEAQLRRRRLVRMLLSDPPVEPDAVRAAAAEAGWTLPRTMAVLALAGPRREAAASRLPPEAITEAFGELSCAVVTDPDGPGRRRMLEQTVLGAGAIAALGNTVGWPQAAISLARARAALELSDGTPALLVARERAGELLIRSDPLLAGDLVRDHLAPLRELSPGAQARLTETLGAWLAEQGRLSAVALRLGIHPQTARYRLARLRELFGPRLDDADERFWLELALRARAVARSSPAPAGAGEGSG